MASSSAGSSAPAGSLKKTHQANDRQARHTVDLSDNLIDLNADVSSMGGGGRLESTAAAAGSNGGGGAAAAAASAAAASLSPFPDHEYVNGIMGSSSDFKNAPVSKDPFDMRESLFSFFSVRLFRLCVCAMTNCNDMFFVFFGDGLGISGNRSFLGRPTLTTAVGSAGAQCGGFGRCFRTRPRCHPPARRNQSRKSPRKPTRGSIAPGDLVPRTHQSQRSRGSFETSTVQQAAAGHRYFACHAKIYSGLFFSYL